jgi:SSS family solute:Na+ symporter
MISGMHGVAWNAAVKDALILVVVVFLGIYLPLHYYGGLGEMFRAIDAAKPGFLAFKPTGQSVLWFQSTVILTALGFFMWPQMFSAVLTSKHEQTFRRNAALLPLYQLILLFAFFCGFAAILQVPGLTGTQADQALLRLSVQTFDPWFVGVIGAAGVMTALVPGSIILVSAATLLANDVLRPLRPELSDSTIALTMRGLVPLLALLAVYFTLNNPPTLVALLLMGYAFITQLFPAVLCSLLPRNPMTKYGAAAGIVVGVVVVAVLGVISFVTQTTIGFTNLLPFLPAPVGDVNVGFAALILNVVAALLVSWATRPAPVAAASSSR